MEPTRSDSGFSLVELTIALGVLMAVLGITLGLLNSFQFQYKADEAGADAQRNARFAISRLEEIIRGAGSNPTSNTTVNAAQFLIFPGGSGTSSIQLKSDLDGDGQFVTSLSSVSDVIVTSENVTLQLNGSSIEMVDNTVASTDPHYKVTIANDIKSVTFTDPTGTAQTVVVDLVAVPSGVSPGDRRYSEVEYTSTIRLRNR